MKKLPVRHLGVLACALGLVLPVDLRASSTPDPNLRLAGSGGGAALVEGDLAVFVVSETAQGGRDLNGDGDADDENVVHVFDARRRAARNLGVALGSGGPLLSPRLLVVPVSEVQQGHRDLNGDGDALDEAILHALDRSRGTLVNLGLQGAEFDTLRADGGRFVASVDEAGQGNRDLNGDGDALDAVLHVFDVAARSVRNVGLAAFPLQFALEGGHFAFVVSEAMHGQADLNGDGDAEDMVLHILDLRRGRARNAGLDAQFGFDLDADRLALLVRESAQGRDLNRDGDLDDFVLHLVDPTTASVRNLRLAAGSHQLREGRLLFTVSEEQQGGVDLNGDGDAADHVAHLIDLPRLEPTNLRLAGSTLLIDSGAVLGVEERMQGETDLNGDGDTFDTVVHMFSRRGARDLVNTRLAAEPFVGGPINEEAAVFPFLVSELAQGGRDLNGDGDVEDGVLHAADPGRGRALNSGLAAFNATTLPVQGNRVVVPVFEFAQGQRDLDGDGLPFSVVPHVFDAATGTTLNSRLPVFVAGFFPSLFLADGFFPLLAPEGSTDRNGDGDTLDPALTLVDLATVTPTRVPFAVVGLGFTPGFGTSSPTGPGPGLGDAFVFVVSEALQGQRDLNGDGDTDDAVFHAVRLEDRNRDRIFDFVQE